jgi:hypothetical protein
MVKKWETVIVDLYVKKIAAKDTRKIQGFVTKIAMA